jgi:Family of unknown function (DUF6464)
MTNSSHDFVIKLALILFLSILPSLVYLLIFRKVKRQWRSRLRRARLITIDDCRDSLPSYYNGDRSSEATRYFIGDTSCLYNAHSPYMRCAVNPSGPCKNCSHYQQKP